MGKPTGFLEIERATIPDRDPLSRVKDWEEIHEHRDDDKVREQGARCMDCGTPYCHTGILLDQRHGLRMSHQQPHPRVERPRLSQSLARSSRTPPQKPTISPNSPVVSAPHPAKAPACSAPSSHPSPSRISNAPSLIAAGKKTGSPRAEIADEDRTGKTCRRRRLRSRRSRLRRSTQSGRTQSRCF